MRANESKWIPYDPEIGQIKHGALDFSWLNEVPAGIHGHVTVQNGHFIFSDGTPVKFFGVNLGFAAATPERRVAEAIAEDLYRSGANMARIHATDCTYCGIIDYTQEKTGMLNTQMLDRLDYLVYCLREKGIYLHLDMTAGRGFHAADGFTEEELEYAAQNVRAVRFFDERIIRLEKEYIARYLTHRNPYTGLCYVEDPAVAIVQYTNENSITWYQLPGTRTAFDRALDLRFNLWLCDKYGSRAAMQKAWTNADGICTLQKSEDPFAGTVVRPRLGCWGEPVTQWDAAPDSERAPVRHSEFMSFLREIEKNTFQDVYRMIRALGYRSAINLSNYPEAALDLEMNALGDVTEKNPYWNHPIGPYTPPTQFYPEEMCQIDPRQPRAVHNSHSLGVASRARVAGKPFVITEWNATNTTPFRADALFQMAAYGAHQDWDGILLFTYTFAGTEQEYFNADHFTDFFTVNLDPAMWSQFGIASAIFRMGLVQKARNRVELGVSEQDLLTQTAEFWRLPMLFPFVSQFGYRFFEQTCHSAAELVISSGCTASGDYRQVKRALIHSGNPFCDAMQQKKAREKWLQLHTQDEAKLISVGSGTLQAGSRIAVFDAGVSDKILGGSVADEVLTRAMREFGLLDAKKGWFADRVVSDTGELTYDIENGCFSVQTDRAAIFAGKAQNAQHFGGCTLWTENDRAAVSIFPLDKRPIQKSAHLLIYAMGRCENTERVWSGDMLLAHGSAPIIYENITAELYIPSTLRHCKAWILDASGTRSCETTVTAKADGICLHLGGGHLYELVLG